MDSLYIQQISSQLPNEILSNREFCFLINPSDYPEGFTPETADSWIFERSGIRSRHCFSKETIGKGITDPGAEVALCLDALQKWNPAWEQVDALICIRSSTQNYMPNLSQRIAHALSEQHGLHHKKLFTLDLVQPSTGLLQALKIARHLPFKNIWVVCCEILTPLLNLSQVGTSMLFGDGVGALWLTHEPSHSSEAFKILDEEFVSTPDSAQVLHFENQYEGFKMKGPELFRKVVPEFKAVSQSLLKKLNFEFSDIQYYLPHQANTRIIERAAHSMKFQDSQIITNIETAGNVSSASMIISLAQFLKQRALKAHDRILLNACGAGLSAGAAVIEKL